MKVNLLMEKKLIVGEILKKDRSLLHICKIGIIMKEYKRIMNQTTVSNNSDKELMSVCLTLGSKFP